MFLGCRYVALTGFPGTPDFNTMTAHFIHTDYELTGSIAFSDPLYNDFDIILDPVFLRLFLSAATTVPDRVGLYATLHLTPRAHWCTFPRRCVQMGALG